MITNDNTLTKDTYLTNDNSLTKDTYLTNAQETKSGIQITINCYESY